MMEEVDLADTPLAMRPQLQAQESLTGSDEEPPDPRIQVELERLNTSTDLINKLEVDLDEARMMFRQTLLESTQQIDNLTKKLGKCVEQARPYYDARIKAKQALTEAQKSAVRYERAVSQHAAAREMVQLAEEGLLTRGCIFDSTWQEMLNHATTKVNDAEREKIESTAEHKDKSNVYHESETRVKVLQKELKRCIAKSSLNARRSLLQLTHIIRMQELQLLPYFELKAAVNQRLEEQKRHVRELECAVAAAKSNYSQALANLETISDQIHKTRQSRLDLGIRGVGVGAESPGPPFCTRGENDIAREKSSSEEVIKMMKAESLEKALIKEKSFGKLSSIAPAEDCGAALETNASVSQSEEPSETGIETIGNGDSKETVQELQEAVGRQSPPKGSKEGRPSSSDSAEQQGSILSGWQFVAIPNSVPSGVGSQNFLAVDDKESIVSDSESLTSMEMLSEEVIANLMLEDELNEASRSIMCGRMTPADEEEYLAPPKGDVEDTSTPVHVISGLTKVKEGENGAPLPPSSSSDSGGDPWEVVGTVAPHQPSPPEKHQGSKYGTTYSNVPDGEDLVQEMGGLPQKEEVSASSGESPLCGESSRPQSLPLESPLISIPKDASSASSSSSGDSFSKSFSPPSYAPLSETPDVEPPPVFSSEELKPSHSSSFHSDRR